VEALIRWVRGSKLVYLWHYTGSPNIFEVSTFVHIRRMDLNLRLSDIIHANIKTCEKQSMSPKLLVVWTVRFRFSIWITHRFES
jgi:hypothetical protein